MSTFWIASLASLATLLGGWGVVRFLQGRAQFMRLLSGVAAGYLLSVTVVRIIPECLEAKGGEINAYWVLAGYLLVHVMEHGITLHFHYGEETHTDGSPLSGVLALVGLSLHSLMDGVAIAAALSTNSNLGPLVVLGILFHRIPEGGTIASIFLVRGFGNRGAMLAAGTLALAAMLGAAGQSLLNLPTGPILGLTAGLALYVASSDLLPEVQKVSGLRSTIALLSGVGIFLLSSRLLPHQH
ncbi:MAG: ZIP family metal transporter [Holophagaceae bacterium]|jgi:zinc transporter ZupT|uniref:ZIP family metal transporter n=1 Tax=Candidatus Geothrix odensensis TaxID=2954440 RepID=A0A936EZP0_9BACT|nr:ZIP family metal transporter [Candidatus Geothrix odensensis]